MNQKIEWYREVLELEPNSKVFFPLARLEAGNGQIDTAIATLRQGIARHPDHIEARLLLVDLLYQQGRSQELRSEVDRIAELLGVYPGFWSAWSARLAEVPETADAALAVRFLAAGLNGHPISWGAVIHQGLQALLEDSAPDQSPQDDYKSRPEVQEKISPPVAAQPDSFSPASTEQLSKSNIEALSIPPAPVLEGELEEFYAEEDGDAEEAFSLKTRSMAEVLAEQGDYTGALAIYAELKANAATKAEEKALSARMEELKDQMANQAAVEKASPEMEEDLRAATGKNRLLDILDSLAQRLEAKTKS